MLKPTNRITRLSKPGMLFVILYLSFVILCIARTESCFRNDGMLCAVGYLLPAFPWIFAFLMLGNIFLPATGSFIWPLLVLAIILSIMINVVLVYRYGRLLGNTAKRENS